MKNTLFITGLILFGVSCTKTELLLPPQHKTIAICYDCDILRQEYEDSNEHPTILGPQHENPYLLPIMSLAFRNVYKSVPKTLTVTHRYVRISPADPAQVNELEKADLDVYDYPLDRDLIQEGDFFPQPGKTEEDIPDYYSVIASTAVIPKGISFQVLAEMHIPDCDTAWENEALRLTGNLYDQGRFGFKVSTDEDLAVSHGNGKPSGRVMVRTSLPHDAGLSPLQNVRVIIRRLFKSERIQTDKDGVFRSAKYFRNKYTIKLKFKNRNALISRNRRKRIYEQFFPITINLGKWDNLDPGHGFIIEHPTNTGTISSSHWCAAITHNSLLTYEKLCLDQGIYPAPTGLHIMLAANKYANHGNTYMLQQIMEDNALSQGALILTGVLLSTFAPATPAAFIAMQEFLRLRAPDITYGYGGDIRFLANDLYSELVFHELAHASHYKKVGTIWWLNFGLAEAQNKGEGPYGDCCTDKAMVTALGEAWAYCIGHLFTDRVFGMRSSDFPEQGYIDQERGTILFSNRDNISSHIYFLESYNPKRKEDPASWIPKGLFFDMMDARAENFPWSGISDNVEGYSLKQLFDAMTKDVKDISDFKRIFIEKYGLSQKDELKDLFRQYGY